MEDPRAFGSYLRAERELRQIPLVEVSAATKIPVRALERLESGDWQELPGEVFVRGFVRSYARHLGLSDAEVISLYVDMTSAANEAAARAAEASEDPEIEVAAHRRFGLALFLIIILIIATITLSLIWRRGASADTEACLRQGPEPAVALSPSSCQA